MKKYLPFIFSILVPCCMVFLSVIPVFAQSPSPAATSPFPSPNPATLGSGTAGDLSGDTWVVDPDVTFAGKAAARSASFVDWAITHPQWYFLDSGTSTSSLSTFWVTIRNIVYAFFALFVLVTAFIIIITRGRNITVIQFIPRFIGIVLLVTFSFAIVQFLYQITDLLQNFFLQRDGNPIGIDNLITIGFNYQSFVGYRQAGPQFDEAAFISIFLTKLTAVTLYVMAGVLFVRKVILWFFICISPVFPLLWFYAPVRNTGKMWLGEFSRWLLYGPLFALLFDGLVFIWSSTIFSNIKNDTERFYPTATNILLGGPGQLVTVSNNLNVPGTFVLYILSLIMLWSAILLPFVLLNIFLDYFKDMAFGHESSIKQLMSMTTSLLKPSPVTPSPVGVPPSLPPKIPPPASTGMARQIPIENQVQRGNMQSILNRIDNSARSNINRPVTTTISNQQFSVANNQILQRTNLQVPTLRDVAKVETNMISRDISKHQEVTKVREALDRISNPKTIAAPAEREKFIAARDQLVAEKQKGNPLAAAILTASNVSSAVPSTQLQQTVIASQTTLPAVNRVQTVSLEDYEAVKKMWQENYAKLEPPKTSENQDESRKEWVVKDMEKVKHIIDLLSSPDQVKQKEGMSMVGTILPFLLIGGFSQTEVIAYLRAKLEAGKSTLEELRKKDEEVNTSLDRTEKKEEKQGQMHAEAELPTDDGPPSPLKDLSELGDNKTNE